MPGFSLNIMRGIKKGELREMKKISSTFRRERPLYRLSDSLRDGINIIAELKHISPSHGVLHNHITDSVRIARYVYGGASAVSILAEREFFGGSYDIMKIAAEEVEVPVLCKDFVFFKEQIEAAYTCGADIVLLIARALEKSELEDLFCEAKSMGIMPLVEICMEEELEKISGINPDFVMVNMRDLESLKIDFTRGIDVLNSLPEGVIAVSASGVNSAADIGLIKSKTGVKNFLVGAALMNHSEPDVFIRELKDVC